MHLFDAWQSHMGVHTCIKTRYLSPCLACFLNPPYVGGTPMIVCTYVCCIKVVKGTMASIFINPKSTLVHKVFRYESRMS